MIDQTIQNKADAYKDKPEELQQQYAVKQDLLDLLALQRIKSEKEAAAREMQLQMAEQQAQQGGPMPVKNTLEREVTEMTKKEMAQQVGGLAQEQERRKQAGLQQLMQRMGQNPSAQMSGIAKAPTPNMANLAGGGIVAFQKGGASLLSPEEEEALRKYRSGIMDPAERERLAREQYEKDVQAAERIKKQRELAEEAYRGATQKPDAYDDFKRWLLSGGSSSNVGALEARSRSMMNVEDQRKQQAQRALEQRNKALQELLGSEMEAGKGLYGAGSSARKEAEITQRGAMSDIASDRRAQFEAEQQAKRDAAQAVRSTADERFFRIWQAEQPANADKSLTRYRSSGDILKMKTKFAEILANSLLVDRDYNKLKTEDEKAAYRRNKLNQMTQEAEAAIMGAPASQPTRAPAASSQALPLPKTKGELEKGKVYTTVHGPAVWDGTQFTISK